MVPSTVPFFDNCRILALSLANAQADKHMNLLFYLYDALTSKSEQFDNYFDNVMTKLMINNRTDA